MISADSSTKTIQITGMTCEACVQKVNDALKGVEGLTVQSVRIGSATVSGNSTATEKAASILSNLKFKDADAKEGACTQTEMKNVNQASTAQKTSADVASAAAGSSPSTAAAPATPAPAVANR